jgi:hypothetical protein
MGIRLNGGSTDGRHDMGSTDGWHDMEMSTKHRTISGLTLIAIGGWAALAPFLIAGWDWDVNSVRFLLTVVPGAAAAMGGLLLLSRQARLVTVGGALALAAGAWFVLAPLAYALFVGPELGTLGSGEQIHLLRWIVFFFGAGAVVSFLSSYSLGLVVPLEFEDEVASQTATATTRARVPSPAERPRRRRGVSEPAPQPADHARGKRSAPRES